VTAPYLADLHIHSHYSRATSSELTPELLWVWAQKKGVGLLATGDFTHPGWIGELKEKLTPTDGGLYTLRPDLVRSLEPRVPASCRRPVHFVLSAEISCIYKQGDRVRKNHNLVYVPDFAQAEKFNAELAKRGNIVSDGRPILGVSARDLLALVLDTTADGLFVPAHVWTPWFSLFGSKSGFDDIEECFGDLAAHIPALETGLSSSPAMNRRWSRLDRYLLISNSDAHSPGKLGRNANLVDFAPGYAAFRKALTSGEGFLATVDTFPQEGKYHADGHRACGVCMEPRETRDHGGICPVCGKPLVLGVSYRVDSLADRPLGPLPAWAKPSIEFITLPEIIAHVLMVGEGSRAVQETYESLLARGGDEFSLLTNTPAPELARLCPPLVAEAILRVRQGRVRVSPGFDGQFGTVTVFEPEEREQLLGALALNGGQVPAVAVKRGRRKTVAQTPENHAETLTIFGLDPHQRAIVDQGPGPVVVTAGPGSGKTRVLVERMAARMAGGADPRAMAAVTFTRKASKELALRLEQTVGKTVASPVFTGTFHGLGATILSLDLQGFGLSPHYTVADQDQVAAVAKDLGIPAPAAFAAAVARDKEQDRDPSQRRSDTPEDEARAEDARRLDEALRARNLLTLPDLLWLPARRMTRDPVFASQVRQRVAHLFVDEYQDVNPVQDRLLRLIVPPGPDADVTVIGDRWQSIYGFRGADHRFFQSFSKDYHAAAFRLSTNYRSTAALVTAVGEAIRDLDPAAVQDCARPGPGEKPLLIPCPDPLREAQCVATEVASLLGGVDLHRMGGGRDGGEAAFSPGEVAVLCRTHAQGRMVAQAIERLGLPVRISSGADLKDNEAFLAAAAMLREWAMGIGNASELLGKFDASQDLEPVAVQALHNTGADFAVEAAVREEARGRRAGELARVLSACLMKQEADTLLPGVEAVRVMTIHAAKGLEFPAVIIAGAERGLLPLESRFTPADPLEERCLWYVALSRATKKLVITWAQRRLVNGQVEQTGPSPFVASLRASGAAVLQAAPPPRRKARKAPELPLK